MSQYWSDVVHRLTPYVPGEQPAISQLIKLNTNENPYGPSPAALAAMQAEVADSLRLYPDPNATRLKQAIADRHGLSVAQVFVGNGSDEVLAHAFQALLNHAHPTLFPDVSYSFYPVYCGLYGIKYQTVPLDAELQIQVDDYLRPNGGVIFPNPNAPTGRVLGLDALRRLLDGNRDSVVVIDEAYVDFGAESAVTLIPEYPQLLVVQTLSKSRSLAGLRVGFAMGHADLIEALVRVKDSFNSYPVGRVAISGAVAALQDDAWFDTTRQWIMQSRDWLSAALQGLGFEVLPSGANFVLARHPRQDAAALALGLREQKILVRHFKLPRIEQFLRITIGTDAECRALVDALHRLLPDA